jgi:hypothetical protein
MPLVEEGFAASLTEAATQFYPAMGTILVGMAAPQQFGMRSPRSKKAPLPPAALDRLTALRQVFAGESPPTGKDLFPFVGTSSRMNNTPAMSGIGRQADSSPTPNRRD